jgi:hypothetical protein
MKPHEETREKFLAAVAERLNPDAIVEAHVFTPLKQGEFESGVAVIAVEESAVAVDRPDEVGAENRRREAPAENRVAVYTAKYRLTIKGPERGRWEFEMHAEADAPLVTVDVVVRGVARRSGDAQEAERLSGDEFRALLPPPPAAQESAI